MQSYAKNRILDEHMREKHSLLIVVAEDMYSCFMRHLLTRGSWAYLSPSILISRFLMT